MKKWSRPVGKIEQFTANEYIASSCWGVACDVNAANDIEKNLHGSSWRRYEHRLSQCGQESHQVLHDITGDGKPDYMAEEKSEASGKDGLRCTVYTDSTYRTRLEDLSTIRPGDRIYWTTTSSITWSHVGTVHEIMAGHPNRS